MSTFQFKRGNNTNFPSVALKTGEPAFVIDTGKLYIGDGSEKILINPMNKIAGLNTIDNFTKFTVNEYGQITTAMKVSEADLPTISASKITGLGSVATLNSGTSAGEIAVLEADGKLPISVLPSIATVEVYEVTTENEMLALNAQKGDVAVRSDISANFFLKTAPASVLANWIQLLVPANAVSNVNGKTGIVIIYGSDINLNAYNKPAGYSSISAADTVNLALGKLEVNFNNYASLNSASLTGTPTAPTAIITDNSTKIATTAFVVSALNVIDGGIF